MKRRSMPKLGMWPMPRPATVQAIVAELIKARTKYPERKANLDTLQEFVERLAGSLHNHSHNPPSPLIATAADVYERAVIVAAMAIRLIEEGSGGYKYSGSRGASDDGPLFKAATSEQLDELQRKYAR